MIPRAIEKLPLFALVRNDAKPTSRAAARKVKPFLSGWRLKVYEAIKAAPDGMLDEEIHLLLGGNVNTIRPRRVELERAGLVRDSGRTRLTVGGSRAVVWEVVP